MELCQLIGYQVDKVTKSFEILTENDIEQTLTNIRKNIDANFEKLSQKIVEINFYVLKN